MNCFWHSLSLSQWKRTSMAFVCFGCIYPLHTASAMELSVCNGVGGCLCPIYSKILLMYKALHAMMYSAASLASTAISLNRSHTLSNDLFGSFMFLLF